MADTHVITALNRKYAELAGLLKQSEERAQGMRENLAHVEATIRLFKEDWDSASITPKRPKAPSRWQGKGRAIQAALAIMRAAGEPLTAREITLRAMDAKGIAVTDPDAIKASASNVTSALKRRTGRGVVAHEGFPRRWSIGCGAHNEPGRGGIKLAERTPLRPHDPVPNRTRFNTSAK
ncbi:MAG: hypothetical protein ABI471_03530 [Sphingomonas bacterium]